MCTKSLQSHPTLFDPIDYSPPGSSVHWILLARILKWVAVPSFRESSPPKDQIQICLLLKNIVNKTKRQVTD